MNCKDFKEISDSYLSNELLVETNHDVLRHLESCADCRGELAARRELRSRLRFAVMNAEISLIDPGFMMRTKSKLRRQAFAKTNSWSFIGARSVLAGVAAVVVIAVAGMIVMQNPSTVQVAGSNIATPVDLPVAMTEPQPSFQQISFVAARKDAIDDHKECALSQNLPEKPISLEKASLTYGKANKDMDEAVLTPLREAFGNKAQLLAAHFCLINGRHFTHVVLKYQGRVVSVLLAKRDDGDGAKSSDAISCQSTEGLNIACFESGRYSVFVISDLNEGENLTIARTISPAVKKHIGQAGNAA